MKNILGVIRSQPSPNTEKDIILAEDKHGEYWAIVIIASDQNLKELSPIIEEIKSVDAEVVKDLITVSEDSEQASTDTIEDANKIESVTSGVIYDG